MIGKLRARMTYSNVVATLALFLVLAGGGAWAAKKLKLKPNSVLSKHIAPDAATGNDVDEATLGTVPNAQHANSAESANSADTAGSASPTGQAGGDLTGTYPAPLVGPDSIGSDEIQNLSRKVSLPLASFVNDTDETTLDFTPSNGTSPDLDIANGNLVIEWNDDSDGAGADVADTDFVRANFTLPTDYAGGGFIDIHFTKDAHTAGVIERFDCQVGVNGFLGNHATAEAFATLGAVGLSPSPGAPYVPGLPVNVRCAVTDGSGGNTSNDTVRVSAIDFLYCAQR